MKQTRSKSKRKSARGSRKGKDLFQLLKHDHQLVSDLMSRIEASKGSATKMKDKLYARVRNELTLHSEAEEKTIYPRLEEDSKKQNVGFEAEAEHDVVKYLLRTLDSMSSDDPRWDAAFKALMVNVETHVEEEEAVVFKSLRSICEKDELATLAQEFQRAKKSAESPVKKLLAS